MGSAGWSFISPDDGPIESCQPEPEYGFSHVSQLYLKADPHYDARFTVPILWDTERATIVNNESSEIIVMLNDKFNQFAKNPALDLFPEHQKQAITEVSDSFYDSFNNGVYRCGFAKTQEAYDEAVIQLFDRLDILENHLSTSRYLVGSNITLADIRLFVTLIRFDPVYVSHFKTDRKRIMDYPNLSGFTADLYQMPSIRKTISFYHIKNHYFRSHPSINSLGIVPIGPDLSYLDQPHGRDKI